MAGPGGSGALSLIHEAHVQEVPVSPPRDLFHGHVSSSLGIVVDGDLGMDRDVCTWMAAPHAQMPVASPGEVQNA